MKVWTKCDDYEKLPAGDWLVKIDDDIHPYHIANVTVNKMGSKLIIVGSYFAWDRGDLIAYTTIDTFEED